MESCNLCREGIYCLSQGHNNNCLSLTEANKSRNGAVERQSGKPHCNALFCWLLSVLYSRLRGEHRWPKTFHTKTFDQWPCMPSKDKEDICMKGTVSWERCQTFWQKCTEIGLGKACGWFLNFSGAPMISYCKMCIYCGCGQFALAS